MTKTLTILITSGGGPAECRLALSHMVQRLILEAQDLLLDIDVAQEEAPHGPKSVVVQIHGEGARQFANGWVGTVQWVCKSSLRPGHKRQNWFVGVFEMSPPQESQLINIKDVQFDTFRAGGPGGQHQNTTDSAVRATCLKTGLSVVVRDGRSQHRNKTLAIERLQSLKQSREACDQANQSQQQNLLHHQLERGNPVRIFKGEKFKEIRK